MATTRLALVNVVGPYDGLWFKPKGNEVGVDVAGLVSGEELWLECQQAQPVRLQLGFTPLEFRTDTFYRFRKVVGDHCRPLPTLVRIHLNGSAQNVSR